MQTREILGKIVELKPEFLRQMFGEEQSKKIKEARPFLVIELSYKGRPQLFAVPLQTSIKSSLDRRFWDKLPARLETEPGYSRGMIYATMIPIACESVLRIKQAEQEFSSQNDVIERIFRNIINRVPERRSEPLPEKALASYQFLRKQIFDKGMSCFNDEAVKSAYAVISKAIRTETNRIIDTGLSKNNFGKRPIIEKAQYYLDHHYLQTLSNTAAATSEQRYFVDMPIHYTDIEGLMKILYTDSQASATMPAPALKELVFQDTPPLRCYPFEGGVYEKDGYVLVKLPLVDQAKPTTEVQPMKIPARHVKLKVDSGGVHIVAASTQLVAKIAALQKNIHIPVKQKN